MLLDSRNCQFYLLYLPHFKMLPFYFIRSSDCIFFQVLVWKLYSILFLNLIISGKRHTSSPHTYISCKAFQSLDTGLVFITQGEILAAQEKPRELLEQEASSSWRKTLNACVWSSNQDDPMTHSRAFACLLQVLGLDLKYKSLLRRGNPEFSRNLKLSVLHPMCCFSQLWLYQQWDTTWKPPLPWRLAVAVKHGCTQFDVGPEEYIKSHGNGTDAR
jgi:hypothetical protein